MLKPHRHRLPLVGTPVQSASRCSSAWIFICAASLTVSTSIGCTSSATRTRVLSAPLASMTHSKIPVGYRIKTGKAVSATFCHGDKPIVETGSIIGMIDQVLYKAQTENQATHLLDLLIMRDGDCVTAEANSGQAVKIKMLNSTSREFEWTTTLLPPDTESTE